MMSWQKLWRVMKMMPVCVDCDTCFNKRYYPSEAIQDVCKFCKEKNWRFYNPDLTDIEGQVVAVRRIKNERI